MAGFDHGPAVPPADEPHADRNARYGAVLFAVYLALYAGFLALNVFAPASLAVTFLGVNLAVLAGLGLIVAAFVLALVYAWLCRAPAGSANHPEGRA